MHKNTKRFINIHFFYLALLSENKKSTLRNREWISLFYELKNLKILKL